MPLSSNLTIWTMIFLRPGLREMLREMSLSRMALLVVFICNLIFMHQQSISCLLMQRYQVKSHTRITNHHSLPITIMVFKLELQHSISLFSTPHFEFAVFQIREHTIREAWKWCQFFYRLSITVPHFVETMSQNRNWHTAIQIKTD